MTPTEKAREAARVAFFESNYGVDPDNYTADLVKALAAYEADLSAQGLVIVPKEATKAMLDETGEPGIPDRYYQNTWAQMISAYQGEGK